MFPLSSFYFSLDFLVGVQPSVCDSLLLKGRFRTLLKVHLFLFLSKTFYNFFPLHSPFFSRLLFFFVNKMLFLLEHIFFSFLISILYIYSWNSFKGRTFITSVSLILKISNSLNSPSAKSSNVVVPLRISCVSMDNLSIYFHFYLNHLLGNLEHNWILYLPNPVSSKVSLLTVV